MIYSMLRRHCVVLTSNSRKPSVKVGINNKES
jgi:hypothetical protein